MVYVTTGAP